MNRTSIKTTAEAVLRELPSVLGAYVSEDLEGNPREVHLLVRPGPDPATLARDLRGLLQERLGIPVDQRVISIAQLAPDADEEIQEDVVSAAPAGVVNPPEARAIFGGIEAATSGGRVSVGIRLEWRGDVVEGTGDAAHTPHGRARAGAAATLSAATAILAAQDLTLELDSASVVQAVGDDYVLVCVLGMSPRTGRRPVTLVGAHPVENDIESAAAFAALKAINRVMALALQST
jgi:hypothetical protein